MDNDRKNDALSKVEVRVLSPADPPGKDLLVARHAVQSNAMTQQVFLQAKQEEWPVERLTEALAGRLSEQFDTDIEKVGDVARYLADEYMQIGNSLLMISRETGRAIAKVTDEDLWVPPPVTREDGTVVKSLPRLRPELEAHLIMRAHEDDRERAVMTDLMRRYAADPLAHPGEARFRQVTRTGRKTIVEELRAALPDLLENTRGTSAAFLRRVPRVRQPPSEFTLDKMNERSSVGRVAVTGTAEAFYRAPIADLKAVNLQHDPLSTMRSVVAAQWVRSFAGRIAEEVHRTEGPVRREVTGVTVDPFSLWVASAAALDALRRAQPGVEVLVVDGVKPVGLPEGAAWLSLDEASYACHARELHDRWEILCKVDYTLWIDRNAIVALDYEPPAAGVAEVLN